WTTGKHSLKFGVDVASTEDYAYNITNQFGNYTYGSVAAFALDFSGNTSGVKHWQSYAQTFGNPSVDTTIRDHGFYAQDQFRITPKLTLNLGLRYEFASLPQPTIINPDYPQTAHIRTGQLNFAPRAGIAYSLANGRTVLRAGYGIYDQRYPAVLINGLFSNNAVYQKSLSLTSAQTGLGPVFPNALVSSDLAKAGSTVEFADPRLRTPYTEQGNVGVEQQLPFGIDLSVSYLWNRGVQGFGVR